jgi:hypothetical protein
MIFDKDGNGESTTKSLSEACLEPIKHHPYPSMVLSGFISARELRHLAPMGKALSEGEFQAVIKRADQDGDVFIDCGDFLVLISNSVGKSPLSLSQPLSFSTFTQCQLTLQIRIYLRTPSC